MDGNQEGAGAAEQPTSPASQPTGQLSQADIEAIIDARTADFKRQFQKGVDKQVGSVRDDVKRILELQESGLNATQIERELQIDRLVHQESAPATPADPGRSPESAGFDVNAVVTKLGLDDNDVLVAAYKVAYKDDPKGLLEKLTGLSQPGKIPSPAGAPLPEGGKPPENSGLTPEQVEAKSATLNRLYDNYDKNREEIAALEKELDGHWDNQK